MLPVRFGMHQSRLQILNKNNKAIQHSDMEEASCWLDRSLLKVETRNHSKNGADSEKPYE